MISIQKDTSCLLMWPTFTSWRLMKYRNQLFSRLSTPLSYWFGFIGLRNIYPVHLISQPIHILYSFLYPKKIYGQKHRPVTPACIWRTSCTVCNYPRKINIWSNLYSFPMGRTIMSYPGAMRNDIPVDKIYLLWKRVCFPCTSNLHGITYWWHE